MECILLICITEILHCWKIMFCDKILSEKIKIPVMIYFFCVFLKLVCLKKKMFQLLCNCNFNNIHAIFSTLSFCLEKWIHVWISFARDGHNWFLISGYLDQRPCHGNPCQMRQDSHGTYWHQQGSATSLRHTVRQIMLKGRKCGTQDYFLREFLYGFNCSDTGINTGQILWKTWYIKFLTKWIFSRQAGIEFQ